MGTKSSTKNVTISADMLAKIMGQLQTQSQQIAALVDTKASAKPAVAQPAKAAPELSIEVYQNKKGEPSLLLKVDGSGWGIAMRPRTWDVLRRHSKDIENALAKLPK
jgi:hypothetical protein